MSDHLTIAVSGLNAIDNPGPGVPVLRSLRESVFKNARLVGFCYGALEPGAYMKDLVDVCYQMPYPSEGADVLMNRLSYIHSIDPIDVIIPNFDSELQPYLKLQSRLQSELGIRMVLPTAEQFEMRQKSALPQFGEKASITVPQSKVYHSLNEVESDMKHFEYPLVVKGRYYDALICYNGEQMLSAFNKISLNWGFPIIIQQFVSGTEFNLIGVGDGHGNLLSSVSMRKMFITDKGKAWAGITVEDEALSDVAKRFVMTSQWRGAFELELMKSNEGVYHLLEVNPRIPAWVYLSTAAGQNIPELIVKMALKHAVTPLSSYQIGKLFIRYSWDMIVEYSEFGSFSVKGEKTNVK